MIFPIEPRNAYGKEGIVYWEDFLSKEEINRILALPNWLTAEKARIGGDSGGVLNLNVRRTDVSWMQVTPDTEDIWKRLSNTISEVNRRYFHFDLNGCYEPAQLGIYKAGDEGHYNWHIDADMTDCAVPRKLSMSLLLSDPSEFEGGELQVKIRGDEAVTLKMEKGRAWFFPSWVLHRVTPVTKGVRRSLVLWVGGPPFR